MIKIIVFMSNALWTPIMWSYVEWLWWTFKGRLRGVYFHRLLCNAKLNLGKINIHELYFDQLFILFVYFEDWGLLSSSIVQFNSLSTDQCYARDKDDGACFCRYWLENQSYLLDSRHVWIYSVSTRIYSNGF